MKIKKIAFIFIGGFIVLTLLSVFVPVVGQFFPFSNIILGTTHYKGMPCNSFKGTISMGDVIIDQNRVCLGERAWFENNPHFCEDFEFQSTKDQCTGIMAAKLNDLSLCNKVNTELQYISSYLNEEGLKNSKLFSCYYNFAILRHDPTVCEKIPFRPLSPYEFNCKESLKQYQPLDLNQRNSPIS